MTEIRPEWQNILEQTNKETLSRRMKDNNDELEIVIVQRYVVNDLCQACIPCI